MANFSATGDVFNKAGPGDVTDGLANKGRVIKFMHVPSREEIRFKAFITEYTDGFTSNWNSESVYGRNDPIMTFQSTQREISLGWDCPASSVEEGIENMQKLSLLMRFLYPSYDAAGNAATIKEAPLMRVKFMNLIQKAQTSGDIIQNSPEGVLCAVSGFTFSPNLEMGFFEDKISDKGHLLSTTTNELISLERLAVGGTISLPGKNMFIIPRVFSLSCAITVLHEEPIGWQTSTAGTSNLGIGKEESDFSFPYADAEGIIKNILGGG